MEILKNFLIKIIFVFFLTLSNKPYLYAGYGSGDLNISGQALEWFISYIKNPGGKKNPMSSPMKFSISSDGKHSWYFYCLATNATQCHSITDTELNKKCEKSNGLNEVFAVGRSIKWKMEQLKYEIKFKNPTLEKK